MKRVSIADVSLAVGLSRGTVSRAFNRNRSDISDETRKRILEVSRRMGYFPNLSARGLVKGTTECIGVVIPDLRNPFLCEMVTEIENFASEKGYSALLALNDGDFQTQEAILSKMAAGQVDGIIITPCEERRTIASLNRIARKKPMVCLKKFAGLRCDMVSFDDAMGVQIMVEHLMAKGHSRIAYLCPDEPEWTVALRRSSFTAAMKDAGLRPRVVSTGDSEPGSAGFEKLVLELLEPTARPTAIFAYDDFLAVHAIRILRGRGMKIPGDVSVAGFDNISLGELMEPRLSTVAIDGTALGKNAIETIFSKIEAKDDKFERLHDVRLIPKLVERDSVSEPIGD